MRLILDVTLGYSRWYAITTRGPNNIANRPPWNIIKTPASVAHIVLNDIFQPSHRLQHMAITSPAKALPNSRIIIGNIFIRDFARFWLKSFSNGLQYVTMPWSISYLTLQIRWEQSKPTSEDVTYLTIALIGWDHSHVTWDIMMTSSNGNIFRVTGPLCGEFTGPGEFPTQRPVKRSFDVFFDLRLNKRLSKQPWGWWFETPSWSLWRQCNVNTKWIIVSAFCNTPVNKQSYCSYILAYLRFTFY